MPLTKLQFKPGINRESTSYSNEGGWFDCEKVRFRAGFPEKIGGWSKYSNTTFTGTCRSLFPWTTLDGTNYIGVGTEQKYYLASGGTYNDITPTRATQGAGSNNILFSATNGSSTITVTDNDHGARVNDYVTFAGAVSLGGTVTAAILNAEHQITEIVNVNSYKIVVSVTANGSDTGDGEHGTPATTAEYQINVGLDTQAFGNGWGAGVWNGTDLSIITTTIDALAETDTTQISNSDTKISMDSVTGLAATDVLDISGELVLIASGFPKTDAVNMGSGLGNNAGSDTTLTVDTGGSFASGDIVLIGTEKMKVTNVSSNDLTVTRAFSGTTIASHADDAVVTNLSLSVTRGHGGTTAVAHPHGSTVKLALGNATSSEDYVTLINDGSGLPYTTTDDVTVDSSTNFASSGYIKIGSEIIKYTSKADSTHIGTASATDNLQRGQFGTTAATHADNAAVFEASFGWGMPTDTTVAGEQLRVWSVDNFGEDLVINVRDGDIYYWDATTGTGARAKKLSDISGSNKAPTVARFIVTSDIDRHILFFGCDSEASTGTQDPLLIRFGDQESITEFQTLATNTAGELRIGTGSEIVAVKQTKQQILVWTDISLHAVQYVGPPYTFSLSEISRSLNIIGPNAAVAVNDIVLWMGNNDFYAYSGSVQKIFCTVKDYVFSDFNFDQAEKVTTGHNAAFGEVWWFYPSADSTTNDKYVIYNYEQKIWYYGNLTRTAWIDRGTAQYPIAAGSDGYLYYHEFGHDDGSTNPVSGISAHIESSQIDVGDGDQFMFARRIIPDLTFRDSSHPTPAATFTVKAREFPGATYGNTSSGSAERTSSSPIELFTNTIDTRIRGRSFAIRVESSNAGTAWRLGTPRVDLRTDGRR